ncbi:MAG: HlyD family efflux transporter periplasmic adaptor subunit [Acetatifactor sp.]|nr:HlyD family efflux transporter periplasmic adaptor subunit [Acetatifactor sp.]
MSFSKKGETKLTKGNKTQKIMLGTFLLICVIAIVLWKKHPAKEEVTYKESTASKGVLESGVSQRGSIDIGTIEQSFELDMSALQRVNASGSGSSSSSGSKSQGGMSSGGMGSGGMGAGGMDFGGFGSSGGSSGGGFGGMDLFGQSRNLGGNNTFTKSDDSSSLTVEEVCVSVGQEIKKGDVLYVLEEESVQKLKETLESNVEKAKADLEMLYADQKVSRQNAQNTYDVSVAYGSYMQTEYNETVAELQDAVNEANDTLTQAKETLAEYEALLAETQTAYDKAVQSLKNCEWSRDNTAKESEVYFYVYYFQLTQQAESIESQLKQKKEQLESRVESAKSTVSRAQKSLNQAKRRLDQGKLEAQETLQLRQLAYNTAQETLDVTLAYLDIDAKEQEDTYADAQEKWDSFSAYVDGCNVCSQYDGTVTSVELGVGDTVGTNSLLVTLNSRADVTMTVTIDERDMNGIEVGTKANVILTAFSDEVFEAYVTEISEAQSDRSGNVTYEVTATLQGELEKLYQSMTGEITFITGKTEEEVLYVPKRAVTSNGEKQTVKVKTADGLVVEREVVTGFTDGVNVEIKEGLAEGEVVLTESRGKTK